MIGRLPAILAAFAALAPAGAAIGPVEAGVEIASDHRRRGLSWSGGKPALAAQARLPVGSGLSVEGEFLTTRGPARHGGADGLADVAFRHDGRSGAFDYGAGATGHVFLGADGQNYAELDAGAGVTFGPLRAGTTIAYAPDQDAIGGDALRLGADLALGVIGTPWTLRAGIGRNSGGDDDARSRRLRPRGTYTDYLLGIDHAAGPLVMGVRLTGTAAHAAPRIADALDRHGGRRIAAYARIGF